MREKYLFREFCIYARLNKNLKSIVKVDRKLITH